MNGVGGLAYRRYVLAMLALVMTLSFVDRNLIILLLQPIKDDLLISDTQLGVVTGVAFGLFYATLGLPIARWADRGDRTKIASFAIGLWGLTVMSCVFVGSFMQLLCARVAAGVGEAGCMPPTYSLIGTYFPERGERTRAMALYWLAAPLSALVSFVAGGWLNARYGWRMTFFVMGIPALLLATLLKTTVDEPRARLQRLVPLTQQAPQMRQVLRVLWRVSSLRHLSVAIILVWTLGSGMAPWYAAFMTRSHGMRTSEIAVWLGSIFGVCGIVGNLIGGHVGAHWFVENERKMMRLSAVTIAALLPCFVLFLLLDDKYYALLALGWLIVVFNFFIGPTFALLQRLVAEDIRATTLSVVMLLANLIGIGLGPQIVGIVSDLLMPRLGLESLRYAMLCMSVVALWAGYHFWQVGRTVASDVWDRPAQQQI